LYVPVGMAVDAGRGAVCGPAGVGNAAVRIEHPLHINLRLVDKLPQLGDLADLLERHDLILLVAIDSETGGVIPAIFETGET